MEHKIIGKRKKSNSIIARQPLDALHQMEFVCEINGIAFINDARATQPIHTRSSIESIDAPVILIVGGLDKGTDYSTLTSILNQKVVNVIYLGADKEQIICHIKNNKVGFYSASDMADAISFALQCGQVGDAVIYSPGCPCNESDSYKSRGNQFKDFVNSVL